MVIKLYKGYHFNRNVPKWEIEFGSKWKRNMSYKMVFLFLKFELFFNEPNCIILILFFIFMNIAVSQSIM